jgi:hypothetical protein
MDYIKLLIKNIQTWSEEQCYNRMMELSKNKEHNSIEFQLIINRIWEINQF